MNELEPFDFEPPYQPDPEDKVTFTLKPLDLRGQTELLFSRDEEGMPVWKGVAAASRYIVGWSGAQLGQFSRARVQQIVNGGADYKWALWLPAIAVELHKRAMLSGADEKKS